MVRCKVDFLRICERKKNQPHLCVASENSLVLLCSEAEPNKPLHPHYIQRALQGGLPRGAHTATSRASGKRVSTQRP